MGEEQIEYIDPSVSKISSIKGFLKKATDKKLEIESTINPEYIAKLKERKFGTKFTKDWK